MTDANIQAKDILKRLVDEIVPESLKNSLDSDFEKLISKVRDQIRLKRELDPDFTESLENEVELVLRNWIRNTLNFLTYSRYAEIMKGIGKTPYSFKKFILRHVGPPSPLNKFIEIERKGIKIGSKVWYSIKKSEYTVISVARNCGLTLSNEDGSLHATSVSPFRVKVLDE